MRTIVFVVFVVVAFSGNLSAQPFMPLSDPMATGSFGTAANGIWGSTVVGYYYKIEKGADTPNGFLYNTSTSTFTTLNDSLGVNGTTLAAISGSDVVGTYEDANGILHGFLYNGSNFTTLNDPLGVVGTAAAGISGNYVVGYYYSDSNHTSHGFIYNTLSSTYTTLDDPLATNGGSSGFGNGTFTLGMSGDLISGFYQTSSGDNGFLYNVLTSTYTPLNDPLGTGTQPAGIYGDDVVGTYYDANGQGHGFVFNGSTYTTLDDPGANNTFPLGIYGNTVVGYNNGAPSNVGLLDGGFIVTVPEPSSIALLGVGIAGLLGFGWRRRAC